MLAFLIGCSSSAIGTGTPGDAGREEPAPSLPEPQVGAPRQGDGGAGADATPNPHPENVNNCAVLLPSGPPKFTHETFQHGGGARDWFTFGVIGNPGSIGVLVNWTQGSPVGFTDWVPSTNLLNCGAADPRCVWFDGPSSTAFSSATWVVDRGRMTVAEDGSATLENVELVSAEKLPSGYYAAVLPFACVFIPSLQCIPVP